MKIALAQIHPFRGEIEKNIQKHQDFVKLAAQLGAEAVFFPELSLTSYEPELAKGLVYNELDDRIDIFQELSNSHNILIGAGMPTLSEKGIMISMLIFQPENQKLIYSKQKLHADELPFFVEGNQDIFIKAKNITIAPAICYESLITEHAEKAYQNAANVYLASVAKSAKGIEKAYHHYPIIAKKYNMIVMMVNCIGYCDNFLSVGKTAIWSKNGELLAQLDDKNEGVLILNTDNQEVFSEMI